jgi:hypothetical protein
MSNRRSGRRLLESLKLWLNRIRHKPPGPESAADRLVPVRRDPRGRSGAAVAEPEEYYFRSAPPRRM